MVRIVTDTTSSLPIDLADELDIPILPQIVTFGETSYRDDTQLSTQDFLEKLRASPSPPTTTAPSPALFAPIFRRLLENDEAIICLHPSADLSGTVRSANVAVQDFPDADIRVVDTRTTAGPLATMVLLAAQWAREGLSADAIVARVEDMIPRQRVYFLVDTLEYLRRGGRIGGASALLGGLLQVKPILTLTGGKVEPFEQQRTARRALARVRELVLAECPHCAEAYPSVMHADARERAEALAADLATELGLSEIPVYALPPAVVAHGGPGLLAVGFFVAPQTGVAPSD